MHILIGICLAVALLFYWLVGHWVARVLVFLALAAIGVLFGVGIAQYYGPQWLQPVTVVASLQCPPSQLTDEAGAFTVDAYKCSIRDHQPLPHHAKTPAKQSLVEELSQQIAEDELKQPPAPPALPERETNIFRIAGGIVGVALAWFIAGIPQYVRRPIHARRY